MTVLGSLNSNSDLATTNAVLPAGAITQWIGTAASPPAGWLTCDGTETPAQYTTLIALLNSLGNPFGLGVNGRPNLPDFQGRVAVGRGTNTAVDAVGENEGIALASRTPHHSHSADGHAQPLTVASHSHTADHPTTPLTVADHNHEAGGLKAEGHGALAIITGGPSATVQIAMSGADRLYNMPTDGHTHGGFTASLGERDVYNYTANATADVTGNTGNTAPDVTGNTGTATLPFLVVNYIIKY